MAVRPYLPNSHASAVGPRYGEIAGKALIYGGNLKIRAGCSQRRAHAR
jgi:hypothetical protein